MRFATWCFVIGLAAFFGNTCQGQSPNWVGSWAAAPMSTSSKLTPDMILGKADLTLRESVHLSIGGTSLRLALSNEFGTLPLKITDVHVAMRKGSGEVDARTDHTVKFGSSTSVIIPPGAFVTSDPLEWAVSKFADLTVSFCLPEQKVTRISSHELSSSTAYVAKGDQAGSESLMGASVFQKWYLLKDIEVSAEKRSAAIVTFGDSITDGAHSTTDSNHRWPDELARRLADNKKTKLLAVINEGIGGNRVLHDVVGESALKRLDRDVLQAPGVRYVVWLEGVNDIGKSTLARSADDIITADQIIAAMKSGVQQMRAHGIKVIGGTLIPYVGAKYSSPAGELMRQAVNAFIRTPGSFDGVIDFEKATQDPQRPDRMLSRYDSGDHLHPNDEGYKAMADAVDLRLFQ
jgi:lysophospholipase L1-like esterase